MVKGLSLCFFVKCYVTCTYLEHDLFILGDVESCIWSVVTGYVKAVWRPLDLKIDCFSCGWSAFTLTVSPYLSNLIVTT